MWTKWQSGRGGEKLPLLHVSKMRQSGAGLPSVRSSYQMVAKGVVNSLKKAIVKFACFGLDSTQHTIAICILFAPMKFAEHQNNKQW